jgi:hypothetical protein
VTYALWPHQAKSEPLLTSGSAILWHESATIFSVGRQRCPECGLYSYHPGSCSVIGAKLRGAAIRALPWPQRFWDRLVVVESGCWGWQGARHLDGYGHLNLYTSTGVRPIGTHRIAWELLVGPVPDKLVFDHLCRNPICVNPSHLEPVTVRENILRGSNPAADNARRTHCVNGHDLRDPANVYQYSYRKVCKPCVQARYRRDRQEGRR